MLQLQARLSNRPYLQDEARSAGIARMTESLLRAFERSLQNQIAGGRETHRDRVLVAIPATMADQLNRARERGRLGD
jgi:hypothetical protein